MSEVRRGAQGLQSTNLSELRKRAVGAEELLTVGEVAEILKVSKATIYRWIHEGHLDSVRVGPGTLRIPVHALDGWKERWNDEEG